MPEVRVEEVRRFMEDSLRAVGAPDSEARAHAELLLHADLTGHYSHGLNRLELYINDIKTGATDANAKPVILKESAATAWVDGCNALGATVGNFCMDLAMKKARESGIGWVSAKRISRHSRVDGSNALGAIVRNFCKDLAMRKPRESGVRWVSAKRCNHFGMAGWWARKAEREGLIGMAFTNSSPIMVPTRSKERALGTNPVAMFAPATGGDALGVDMASTTAAMGKIEVQIHKGEPIPHGWALGPDGKTTTDAQLAFDTGHLLPLGGFEPTSGYKGYCLSAMIEVFCSGLSGANASHQVRSWSLNSDEGPMHLGQCFAAINPECFAPGFAERVADCLKTYRNLQPVDPSLPVLAPGDKERINAEKTAQRGTIVYAQGQIDVSNAIAATIGVKPIQVAA